MKKMLLLMIPGFAVLMLFAACGSNSGSSDPGVAAVGTCSIGYVYSPSYGCITQGSCPANYGSYGGSCVPASASQCGVTSGYPYTTGQTYPYNTGYNSGYQNQVGGCGTTGYGYQNPGAVTYPNSYYPYGYPVYYSGGRHHYGW